MAQPALEVVPRWPADCQHVTWEPPTDTDAMSETSEKVHHPGEIVPQSGIYECHCGQGHEYSTDVKGHRFPPLHEAGSGSG